jgi:PHS family inorganic phosphate transporter-like MFS transporter
MAHSENSIRDIVVTGVGFAADAYDLFVIGAVLVILRAEYADTTTETAISILSAVSLAAAVVGQLLFGFLASRFGRKKLFVLTSVLIIIGAIASGCVVGPTPTTVLSLIIVCR